MSTSPVPHTVDVHWTVRLRWDASVRRDAPGIILDRLDGHFETFDQADRAARFVAEWAGLPMRRFVITAVVDDVWRTRPRRALRPCRHSVLCRHMT